MWKRICLLILLVCAMGIVTVIQPTQEQTKLVFEDSDTTPIVGTYYPGTQDVGVLIALGFSSMQNQATPLVATLVAQGVHVFTFDYAGHGKSPGTLGFDNDSTAYVYKTIDRALRVFTQQAELSNNQVVLVGHSMGAKGIFELMVKEQRDVAGVALIAPNMDVQAASQPFWMQTIDTTTFTVPTLLARGSWDEILDEAAFASLYTKMGNTLTRSSQQPFVLHNYEMYAASIQQDIIALIADASGISLQYDGRSTILLACWFLIFVTSLCYVGLWIVEIPQARHPKSKKIVQVKIVQYGYGLVAVPLIIFVVWFLAGGVMIFPLSSVASMCVVGFGTLIYYRKHKVVDTKQVHLGQSIVGALILLYALLTLRSGIGDGEISNQRLAYFIGYAGLLYPFFYGQYLEFARISFDRKTSWVHFLLSFAIPLLLFVVFSFVGSWSGAAGLLLYLWSGAFCYLLNRVAASRQYYPVFSSAFLSILFVWINIASSVILK
ncbi:MAG: alpha/beta hydrolase [Erysipelotrichaceae bacterium]